MTIIINDNNFIQNLPRGVHVNLTTGVCKVFLKIKDQYFIYSEGLKNAIYWGPNNDFRRALKGLTEDVKNVVDRAKRADSSECVPHNVTDEIKYAKKFRIDNLNVFVMIGKNPEKEKDDAKKGV